MATPIFRIPEQETIHILLIIFYTLGVSAELQIKNMPTMWGRS